MKLASVRSQDPKNRHGEIIVVSQNNHLASRVDPQICVSLLESVENWMEVSPHLSRIYDSLNQGTAKAPFQVDLTQCIAPLPMAPGFYDGSAFLTHVMRARKARGDEMPASAKVTPLMYQGVSDNLLSSTSQLELMDPAFGGDFEGEFGVVVNDVPRGTPAESCGPHIILLTLLNDITYREVLKTEIETKFGFLQSKPNNAFAPILVTPDELGRVWDGGRINANLNVRLNGEPFGNPNGSEMNFSFSQLVAHAARTRPLSAGTIIGSGTVSNADKDRGFACLTEKRFQEIIELGRPVTGWLKRGDRVHMDVSLDGVSVFGAIDQMVS